MTTLVEGQIDRIEYQEAIGRWQTPHGRTAMFAFRQDTSDWNTISSILAHDEYGLGALHLEGLALDIGAHLGAAGIAMALDNPGLRVVAVEAISENAALAERNVALNDLSDRVTVLHRAAASPEDRTADVWFRSTGDENATHHAFIGNSSLVYPHGGERAHETETVACISLSGLLGKGNEASLVKMDCEGCEWSFLTDPAVSRVALFIGEWHPTGGHTGADVVTLLSKTHDVTLSGPPEGPGAFRAVRK